MSTFILFLKNYFILHRYIYAVTISLFAIIVLGALGLSLCEQIPFFKALYLSLITAFTIGYGDITPHTTIGKIICVCQGFIGLIYIGIWVAVANRALIATVKKNKIEL